ncbi:putative endopolygalacturonase D [Dactylonectria macrodidyma]|uniref:endo-polygalacturonase n=1 Tax=Dactylonectria macrodidyma TaxID=307937 RepID=A0A9P9ESH9_9HYPO|nr:putative endopolygalacturonase D [Dactylonectria macrodidyma]
MKPCYLVSAAVPSVLGCANWRTHSCAGAFVSSSADAASFCATFTAAVVTATDAVPTGLLSACDGNVGHLSSACSCYVAAAATGAADVETSSAAVSTAIAVATSDATSAAEVVSTPTAIIEASTPVVSAVSSAAAISTFVTLVASSTAAAAVETTAVAVGTTAVADANACTVTDYAQLSSAVASCTNIILSDLAVPASSTLDLESLQTGAVVTFSGTTTFGTTVDSDFDPIVISGDDITITGTSDHVIEGNGAAYWDGQGSNGGGDKPNHFIVLKHTNNAKVTGLNIKNWPVHCFYMQYNYDLVVSDITLDNSAGDEPNDSSDGDAAAHNSDGFDISSSDGVTLSNIWVHNQDDCVAVTSGSNIVIDGIYCYGGHGLSIGSIGGKSNNTVDGVTFANAQIIDSQNGARIKSNSGTTGTVSNITYRNVTLSGITKYGIDVQQDYLNGGPTGEPTNGVTISGITFEDVTGTTTGSAYNYYILCGDGSCSDFTYTGVSVTGGSSGGSCNYPSSGCPA